MSGQRAIVECRDCGRRAPNGGRRLCDRCYYRNKSDGTLETYPRAIHPAADLVEDYEFLARYEGLNRRLAAERMGVSLKRLEKAIERHSRRMREAS